VKPAPVVPLLEVGRGTGTRAVDQRERVIINRPPTTARERREVADALLDAMRLTGRL
jgi:hypothetical protein